MVKSKFRLALCLLSSLFCAFACSTSEASASYRLTAGQEKFSQVVASLTAMNINVIRAWCFAEDNGSAAARHDRQHKHNWLNIGYYDSGAGSETKTSIWHNPTQAGIATAAFLQGQFLHPSAGIRRIWPSRLKHSAKTLINYIWKSGWASSGYGHGSWIFGAYRGLRHKSQPKTTYVRLWRNPDTHKRMTVGCPFGC